MQDLLERLAQNRDALRAAVTRVPPDKTEAPLGPDNWTIRELVAHLASAEWSQRYIAQIVVNRPGHQFKPVDRDKWNEDEVAKRRDKSLEALWHEWENERAQTIEFFQKLTPGQAAHTAQHPRWGEITPVSVGYLIVDHTDGHRMELETALE